MITFSANVPMAKRYGVVVETPRTEVGKEYYGEIWLRQVGALPRSGRNKPGRGKAGDNINIDAYATVAERNNQIVTARKQVAILSSESLKEGHRGILEESLEFIDTNLDELADSNEFEWAFKMFKGWRKKILREAGLDIVRCILRALTGDKLAVSKLAKTVEDYELEDVMFILCNHPGLGERLRELC